MTTTNTMSFLALSCVGAFATAPAFAEEPAARDAKPVARIDDQDERRGDVIVNGKLVREDPKQVAPLVNTPKSIVVLDKSVIEQTGSNSLQDALRTVPGITFGAAEGGNPIGDRPFIRGFDSQGSIYVDGVRDLASQSREVFATDSVQIVRGSDSTLGGRGSAGGTINILSRLPQAQNFGNVTGSFGNASYKRVTGDLNLKVMDNLAFRVEGLWHDQNVAGRDAIYARRWGVAPSVTLGIGTPTRLTASYYYLESHELPDSGLPYKYVCSATQCNVPAGMTGNVLSQPALGRFTTLNGTTGTIARSTFYGLTDRDFRNTDVNQATIRVEHDFGKITLRNTARFNRDYQEYSFLLPDDSNGDVYGVTNANGVQTIAPGTRNPVDGGTELVGGGYVWRRANTRYGYTKSIIDQTDLAGTFATGGIKHSFAVGTEFSFEKTRRGAFVLATGSTITPRCDTFTVSRYYCTSLFNPNPNDPFVNYASDTSTAQTPIVKGGLATETQNDADTQAVYGFDSITIVPAVILNLGVRYDRFKSTVTPPVAAGTAAYKLSRTDRLFNYQVGLVVKPTRETSLYASYATAATPPNTLLGEGREDNALPTTTTAANLALLDNLKVQKTRSYEVGAKASIFHEQLALAAAVFQTDIQNARVTIDANTVAFLGRTRIRGVELTASGNILPGWTIFGGYTHLDPVVLDGGNSALTAAAVGTRAAQVVYVTSVNTGRQVPSTVRNSVTATTNVTLYKRFQIGGSAIYNDRQYGGYADNRTATQNAAGVVTINPATVVLMREVPAYVRFDARASYDVAPHIQLSVNAQNITDKAYFSSAYANHYATIAAGRTVFGTVKVGF